MNKQIQNKDIGINFMRGIFLVTIIFMFFVFIIDSKHDPFGHFPHNHPLSPFYERPIHVGKLVRAVNCEVPRDG